MEEVRKVLPDLKIKPGWEDNATKSKDKKLHVDCGVEALLAIKEYLDNKNISVFKLFREFDKDNNDAVDYREFIQGIKVHTG